MLSGKSEPDEPAHCARELREQRAAVVGDPVALADAPDARRHVRVAPGRDAGEEVVLDLEPEMTAEQVPEPADLEIAAAHHLSYVPLTPILVHEVFLAEGRCAFREMPTVDDDVGPPVPH